MNLYFKKINNTEHLCAYFTAEDEIDTDELKEYLKEQVLIEQFIYLF